MTIGVVLSQSGSMAAGYIFINYKNTILQATVSTFIPEVLHL